MTVSLGVRADRTACLTGGVGLVIASLPVSLHAAPDRPDLVAVSGESGWSDNALNALRAGIRGVLVVNPVVEDAAALGRAAADSGVPVVIDRPMASNPIVPAVAPYLAKDGELCALLESRMTGPVGADLHPMVLDQLALVRLAGAAPAVSLQVLAWTGRGYVLQGRLAGGRRMQLTGICTNSHPPGGHLRLLGAAEAVELTVPDPGTARPARLTITTADGATSLPTIWETGHRASWRRLHDLVLQQQLSTDLDAFIADVVLLGSLAGGR